jgi:hypothetical protein
MNNEVEREIGELAFLRYFYSVAGDYMGPADADIYNTITENYDGTVPESYRMEEVINADG